MGMGPILIVEDDAAVRTVLVDALEADGYPAIAVTNGADGIAAIELVQPRLVLLDLNMPIVDGNGVADALRRRGRDVPIVVVSGSSEIIDIARDIGATGYVRKPFELTDLMAVVRRVTDLQPPLPAPDGLSPTA